MNELFIGGGGFDGFTFLGSLEYIHKNNLLDLKRFYGCSIGSLLGLMYISGKTPTEILNYLLLIDAKEIIKIDIRNITTYNSIFDSSALDTLINGIDYPSETTLGDVYEKSGVHVNIFVTNITSNQYQNLNSVDNSDVQLKDAIKASMSIPFLFPPVIINNNTYIDGCFKNFYGAPPDDRYILGYSIIGKFLNESSHFNNVLASIINLKEPRGCFIIKCDKKDNNSKYFNTDSIDKLELIQMYSDGVKFAKDQLQL
mgnify:CR=1 FL=1